MSAEEPAETLGRGSLAASSQAEVIEAAARDLLHISGGDPTDEEKLSSIVQILQQFNTTIHARESDPFLPDADNMQTWDQIRPGTSDQVMTMITDTVEDERRYFALTNDVRRSNERGGFFVSSVIAIGSIPSAIFTSWIGASDMVAIAILVMGIGGPTAANFFNNYFKRGDDG